MLSRPDPEAERLLVVGSGDSLPLAGREDDPGDFRAVLVYALGVTGYVGKSTGVVMDIGQELPGNLGYAKALTWVKKGKPLLLHVHCPITSIQPDGTRIPIQAELGDGCPIVEETSDEYKIQLPNGIQGWVPKSMAIRVLSSSSLAVPKPGTSLLTAVLGTVLLGGLNAVNKRIESDRLSDTIAEGIRRV